MRFEAESSHPSLHQIKPFLATEAFETWFRNRFPEIIPVDKIAVRLPGVPLGQRLAWGALWTLLGAVFMLIALGVLYYGYLSLRVRSASGKARLYWIYRQSLMLLNQMGLYRNLASPREYARQSVDPALKLDFETFMDIYHRAKYAPDPLAEQDQLFATGYPARMRERVFSQIPLWERIKHFTNFIRTLRFLLLR